MFSSDTMTITAQKILPRAHTGIPGLDDILEGGLARNRLHLLEGTPGTGKTTIALQFLLAGASVGETGLYVSLAETEEELREGAASHGWRIDERVSICELVRPESVLDPAVSPPPSSESSSGTPLLTADPVNACRCSAATSRGKTCTPPVAIVKS